MRIRSVLVTVLSAAMLLVAPIAVADTLEPGGSVDLLAEGGMCSTSVSNEPNDPAVNAVAGCDPDTNHLLAVAGIDELIDADGEAEAIALLTYLFDVDGEDGIGNTIDGDVSYTIDWSGVLAATSGTAGVSITLGVWDLSSGKDPIEVASATVHVNADPGDDSGSDDSSVAVDLIRGAQYAVVVSLEAGAALASTMDAETVLSDFFEEPHGVTIAALSVSSEFDIAALVEQVLENTLAIEANQGAIAENSLEIEANTVLIRENRDDIDENFAFILLNTAAIEANSVAIAANSQAIETLATALAALAAVVEDLRGDFQGHTHTYLTGRGVGHNNTEATTTEPPEDDTPPEPVPLPQGNAANKKQQ